jgi:hypothetical protein
MGQIVRFPTRSAFAPVHIRGGHWHVVSVRIVDQERPEEARWYLQFAMQRAASFRCFKGFNDHVARLGERHVFEVSRTHLIRRFLLDIETLVLDRRVSVHVDGVRSALRCGRSHSRLGPLLTGQRP